MNTVTRPEEKRKEERVKATLPVKLEAAAGITLDVSASGIFFETDVGYAVGRSISLTVEFETPGGKMMLKCEGSIVRVEPRGARVGVAVEINESALEPCMA